MKMESKVGGKRAGSSRRGVVIGCGPLESKRLTFWQREAVPCTVDLKMMKPGCWMGGLREVLG